MKAFLILFVAGISLISAMLATSETGAVMPGENEDQSVSFEHDVFPIIEEHCLPCHLREERNMSRLFMDDYELLMKGGFNGPPVEPGNPEESLLVKKVSSDPPFGERMPMRTSRYLNEDEMNIIIQWIEEGARDN